MLAEGAAWEALEKELRIQSLVEGVGLDGGFTDAVIEAVTSAAEVKFRRISPDDWGGTGECNMTLSGDLRCSEFTDLLATSESHYPLSDRYVAEVHDSPDKTGDDGWEHMVSWYRASEATGSDGYTRNTPNYSAR